MYVVVCDDVGNGQQGRSLEAVGNIGNVVDSHLLGQRQGKNYCGHDGIRKTEVYPQACQRECEKLAFCDSSLLYNDRNTELFLSKKIYS